MNLLILLLIVLLIATKPSFSISFGESSLMVLLDDLEWPKTVITIKTIADHKTQCDLSLGHTFRSSTLVHWQTFEEL